MRNLLFVFLAACGGSSPVPSPVDAIGTTGPTGPTDGRIAVPDAGVFLDAPADAPSTTPFPDAL